MSSMLIACSGSEMSRPAVPTSRASEREVPKPAPLGIVSGRLLMVGGAFGSGPYAVGGTVEAFVGEMPSSSTASVPVPETGHFQLTLPAGSYSLRGRSPNFGASRLPCNAPGPTVVLPGSSVKADVLCPRK